MSSNPYEPPDPDGLEPIVPHRPPFAVRIAAFFWIVTGAILSVGWTLFLARTVHGVRDLAGAFIKMVLGVAAFGGVVVLQGLRAWRGTSGGMALSAFSSPGVALAMAWVVSRIPEDSVPGLEDSAFVRIGGFLGGGLLALVSIPAYAQWRGQTLGE